MKIASLLLLPLLVSAPGASEPSAGRATLELLDAPGGKVTAVLLPGAPTRILEQREGYVRVVVEGWIRATEGGASGPAPAPAPPAAAGPALAGRIETPGKSGERRPGAYARVAVLAASEQLDRDREALQRAYRSERESLERRIGELEAAGKKALNSSDNMTEAARRADQIRSELAGRRKELEGLDARFAGQAGELYRKHQLAETVADPGGNFVFPSLPPGRYRLAVTASDASSTWHGYAPAEVPPGGGGWVDLTADEAKNTPF
jgi:hypothetical protein